MNVNQLRGRGYKRMVRDAYDDHIDDDAVLLAKTVDREANKVVDALLALLSEDSNQA